MPGKIWKWWWLIVLLILLILWIRACLEQEPEKPEPPEQPQTNRVDECPLELSTAHTPGHLFIRFANDEVPAGWLQIMHPEGVRLISPIEFESGGFLIRTGATDEALLSRAFALVDAYPGKVDYIQTAPIYRLSGEACCSNPATSAYPNDPCYEDYGQEWLEAVGAPAAWEITTGSDAISVGVIDIGVACTHPDLDCDEASARDFFDLNMDGSPKNSAIPIPGQSHGTQMAGIIGADTNNGSGIVALNWDVGLVPLRAGDTVVFGDAAARAIEYAADIGVSVLNLSFETFSNNCKLEETIEYAAERDVLVVASAGNAAAGNAGTNNDTIPVYPASYPNANIIAVAATDVAGSKILISNFGRCSVDLGAPSVHDSAVGVLSTNEDHACGYGVGTSQATAIVSGAAALLRAAHPSEGYAQIRDRLLGAAQARPMTNTLETRAGGWLDIATAIGTTPPIFSEPSVCTAP